MVESRSHSLRRISGTNTSAMLNLRARANFTIGKRNLSYRQHYRAKCTVTAEKPILYGDVAAPPVRFVAMTASILGVELEHRTIDLFASENRTESYRRINPLQKVPALVSGADNICDSHVISLYLCRKWDHFNVLYPKDALAKAKVDEMLFFNSSTLFPIDSEIFTRFFSGTKAGESKCNEWTKALDFLENRLHYHTWLAGDRMFLCDICAASTITSVLCLIPLADHHVRLKKWLIEIEKQPFFDINKKGIERLMKFVEIAKKQIVS
ncbi:unnamed protein product, partial [Iphiclides podalirius]